MWDIWLVLQNICLPTGKSHFVAHAAASKLAHTVDQAKWGCWGLSAGEPAAGPMVRTYSSCRGCAVQGCCCAEAQAVSVSGGGCDSCDRQGVLWTVVHIVSAEPGLRCPRAACRLTFL